MASKSIMIDDELYEDLKKLKKEKSFSELIRELLNTLNTPPLSSLASLKEVRDRLDYSEIKQQRGKGETVIQHSEI